jgi:hypothetical protein
MSGHDRVKLLCTEEAIDGCSEQRQVVTAGGCVAAVIGLPLDASRLNKVT